MAGTIAVGVLVVAFASGNAPAPDPQPAGSPAVVAQSPPLAVSPETSAGLSPTPSPSPAASPAATPTRAADAPTPEPGFKAGDAVTLSTSKRVCLQSYAAPGFASKRLECLADGSAATLAGDPRYIVDEVNGSHWWWPLDGGGWMIEEWMIPRD